MTGMYLFYTKIVDKRVSRHHAIIEVSGSTVTVQPIHTNPTFYKACDATKFEPLEKGQPKELHNGDLIAFLPNDVIFKVLRKDESDSFEIESETKEEMKIGNNAAKDENDLPVMVGEEKQESDIVQPLKKTRQLPSWMTNKQGKTPSSKSKKANTAETISRKGEKSQENTGTVTNEEEMEEKCNKEGSDNDPIVTKDKTESNDSVENGEEVERKSLSPVSEEEQQEEPKKRKRKKSDISDDESSNKPEKTLPSCPYGTNCYRKNPEHFQEYSHDQSSDKSDSEEELPECPYGLSCYRRNRQHQKDFRHSATPRTRERRAKKAKTKDADDDGLLNNYDSDDSFMNDESESSCEPSEVEEDSDWQPDDEEFGDEDVTQLLSEAKQFAKNKKMRKPT